VEACEPWCEDATPVTQIAVLRSLEGNYHTTPGDTSEGVVRALQQLGHQFDFLPVAADCARYELVIVPETVTADAALAARLRRYLKQGGAVLFAGKGGLGVGGQALLAEQGIAVRGESPFQTTYLRFEGATAPGIPATDHVMYERGLRIVPKGRARRLVRVVEPYFDRNWQHFSSHAQTPPDKATGFAAAVQSGRVITIAYPVFKAYGTHGNLPYRHLIGTCIGRLLPQPLVRMTAPSFVEATVMRQRRRTIVHLLSYCPARRTPTLDIVEEPVNVANLPLSLRLARAPKQVTLAPQSQPLAFAYRNGRAEVTIPELRGHAMVVFE
jgi:hypothetical protein